jgi:hypothetical protein
MVNAGQTPVRSRLRHPRFQTLYLGNNTGAWITTALAFGASERLCGLHLSYQWPPERESDERLPQREPSEALSLSCWQLCASAPPALRITRATATKTFFISVSSHVVAALAMTSMAANPMTALSTSSFSIN